MEQLLSHLSAYLANWGIKQEYLTLISSLLVALLVLITALIADIIAKSVLLKFVERIIDKTKTRWDDKLQEKQVLRRVSHIAPALVIYAGLPLIFVANNEALLLSERIVYSCIILIITLALSSLLNALSEVIQSFEAAKDKPIKTYVQVIKIFISSIATILILATLFNRSPLALLSGLGAMTAIVMLIFKDSILSFVASVQLFAYDLVRVGDWIEFKKYGADGDVIDISLNVIKIQNWDKTISTIPTHAFISDSFKNWRGMKESGGRRIKRSLNIDMNSVKFCNEDLSARLRKIQAISKYIEQKENELASYNQTQNINKESLVNGRRLTNLGTFRAYIKAYLKNHPKINQNMTLLVRQLAPGQNGIPIELYCFSSDQEWSRYEDNLADIFDHLLASLSEFDLQVFQSPSGSDFKHLISTS